MNKYNTLKARIGRYPEKMDTIAILSCLLLTIATTKIGVDMRTKIYTLSEPSGIIRYVGKTSGTLNDRLYDHLYEAKRGINSHKNKWIRMLLRQGLLPTIHQIDEVEGDGCDREIGWISFYKIMGLDLVNATDGGDGLFNPSVETCRKIGESHSGSKHWAYGQHLSAEIRNKMSKAHQGEKAYWYGKHLSAKTCKKMREAHIGQIPWNKGKHTGQIVWNKGRTGVYSEEALEKMRESGKKYRIRKAHNDKI